jgi:hypothetical protein
MRILLISLPRTGSNSLMKQKMNELNLTAIGELFNPQSGTNGLYDWETMDNIILKTIVNQVPVGVDDIHEFWIKISTTFDEVILLSRKNLVECAQSLAFFDYYKGSGFKYDSKYTWKPTPNFQTAYEFVKELDDMIVKLSNELNIPITYYEDIFDSQSKQKLRNNSNHLI